MRVAEKPAQPKTLAEQCVDKHLADRARKARHRARQPSQPVAPIPDAHYTRVGGRCAAVDHVGRRVSPEQFDARRRGDARDRDGGIREELAKG